jgi:hypothetical protein
MAASVLNLDQLTGRANPVIVEKGGHRYEMIRPEGLTLKQNNEWQATAKMLLQNYGPRSKKVNSDDEVGEAVDECLRMICPAILDEEKPLSLGEKIQQKLHPERVERKQPFSFDEKLKVLEFFVQQVFPKLATSKSGRKKH